MRKRSIASVVLMISMSGAAIGAHNDPPLQFEDPHVGHGWAAYRFAAPSGTFHVEIDLGLTGAAILGFEVRALDGTLLVAERTATDDMNGDVYAATPLAGANAPLPWVVGTGASSTSSGQGSCLAGGGSRFTFPFGPLATPHRAFYLVLDGDCFEGQTIEVFVWAAGEDVATRTFRLRAVENTPVQALAGANDATFLGLDDFRGTAVEVAIPGRPLQGGVLLAENLTASVHAEHGLRGYFGTFVREGAEAWTISADRAGVSQECPCSWTSEDPPVGDWTLRASGESLTRAPRIAFGGVDAPSPGVDV